MASNYHIEVNPSDAGNNDRVVIQELLKTVAQTHQLNSDSQRDFKGKRAQGHVAGSRLVCYVYNVEQNVSIMLVLAH